MKNPTFDAVLFDCDGVLVDSEPITNGVLRDMLAEAGWNLSAGECMRIFVGKAVKDEVALIHAKTGKRIDEAWMIEFRKRRDAGLRARLVPIDGATQAVVKIHAHYAGRIACASGADRAKVELQLNMCALMPYFEGHIFSGYEMARSKPFPDVYLAAAAALGVDPKRCAVVEDSVTGVLAGVASGATVFGYSRNEAGHSAPAALLAAGVVEVFTDMADLPRLLSRFTSPAFPLLP